MKNNLKEIRKIAQKKVKELDLAMREPMFKKVLGRLVRLGILQTTMPHTINTTKMPVQDYLHAGLYEPRILEVLPGLLLKRPGLFKEFTWQDLPEDLQQVLTAINAGVQPPPFRNVPAKKLMYWLDHV